MWGAAFCADKYDQMVTAWRHGPPSCPWAGLATLSHPSTCLSDIKSPLQIIKVFAIEEEEVFRGCVFASDFRWLDARRGGRQYYAYVCAYIRVHISVYAYVCESVQRKSSLECFESVYRYAYHSCGVTVMGCRPLPQETWD